MGYMSSLAIEQLNEERNNAYCELIELVGEDLAAQLARLDYGIDRLQYEYDLFSQRFPEALTFLEFVEMVLETYSPATADDQNNVVDMCIDDAIVYCLGCDGLVLEESVQMDY
jgi:hypothetical protein